MGWFNRKKDTGTLERTLREKTFTLYDKDVIRADFSEDGILGIGPTTEKQDTEESLQQLKEVRVKTGQATVSGTYDYRYSTESDKTRLLRVTDLDGTLIIPTLEDIELIIKSEGALRGSIAGWGTLVAARTIELNILSRYPTYAYSKKGDGYISIEGADPIGMEHVRIGDQTVTAYAFSPPKENSTRKIILYSSGPIRATYMPQDL